MNNKGMVFSILIMIMLSSLLLFMLSYLIFQSYQQSTYSDAQDGWILQSAVRDVQADLAYLSGTKVITDGGQTVLANISPANYSSYVLFMQTLYRERTFRNISLAANDTFFAENLTIEHDRIRFPFADNVSLRLQLTNETDVIIDTYALQPGTFPLFIELYDQDGNIDSTVLDFIDPDQNQFFNLTNGLRVTIDARELSINGNESYFLSVLLPLNTLVYFDASLRLASGLFSYDARIPYP